MKPATRSKTRFKSIDALRGIAALLVLLLHVSQVFLQSKKIAATGLGMLDFIKVIDLGRIGITIFFIISGFVICKSFNSKEKELKSFVIKRFFRLYPLFWFSLIVGAFVLWPIGKQHLDLGILAGNATMIPAFFGQPFVIGLYWTLETELLFYILMSALYFFGVLRNSSVILGLTLLCYAALVIFMFVPATQPSLPHWMATPYHLSLMLLGVSMRYAFDEREDEARLSRRRIATLHLLLLLAIPFYIIASYLLRGIDANLPDAIAYLIGISIFVIGLKALRSAPSYLVYLGTISYSIYLLHPIVFTLVRKAVLQVPALYGLHISFYLTICTVLTIIFSALTYKFIEAPANAIGKKLAQRNT
jgi:peptidoglycan/LPS O-acetylase OafA/YrhL